MTSKKIFFVVVGILILFTQTNGLCNKEKIEKIYTIQKGDTLSGIGKRLGTSVKEILKNNPKIEQKGAKNLYPGDKVKFVIAREDQDSEESVKSIPKEPQNKEENKNISLLFLLSVFIIMIMIMIIAYLLQDRQYRQFRNSNIDPESEYNQKKIDNLREIVLKKGDNDELLEFFLKGLCFHIYIQWSEGTGYKSYFLNSDGSEFKGFTQRSDCVKSLKTSLKQYLRGVENVSNRIEDAIAKQKIKIKK